MFNKNFILLVVGQVITIFAGSLLSFILGLYLLDITGSAALFSEITALSLIPWLILCPIGGILADKYNTAKIMMILDLIVGIILIFSSNLELNVTVVAVLKILFSSTQSIYHPSVVSSLPNVVNTEYLAKANSISSQVNAISRISAPMLGGLLYAYLEVSRLILIVGMLFLFSSFIEAFIKVKKSIKPNDIKTDSIKLAIAYLKNSKLLYLLITLALISCSAVTVMTTALPYIINVYLDMNSKVYGFISTVAGLGSVIAGIVIYKYNRSINMKTINRYYFLSAFMTLFIGICLKLDNISYVLFFLTTLGFLTNVFLSLGYTANSIYIQRTAPSYLLAKVISIVTILNGFFEPLFMILYGNLFDLYSPVAILIVINLLLVPIVLINFKLVKKFK